MLRAIPSDEPSTSVEVKKVEDAQRADEIPKEAGVSVEFESILYPGHMKSGKEPRDAPEFFHDLNLDQIVQSITAEWQEYDLGPFFYFKLDDLATITYRQEIMKDLQSESLMQAVRAFGQKMRSVRELLTQMGKLHYRYEKERWFVRAVQAYGLAVEEFARALSTLEFCSDGMRTFHEYLAGYAVSDAYRSLVVEAGEVIKGLSAIQYTLLIRGLTVTVRNYDAEPDYSAEVEHTFEKFRRGAVKDYRAKFSSWVGLNHIEAQVLDQVALLNPAAFGALDGFWSGHQDYLDPVLSRFDREIHFYVSYLSYIARFRQAGLSLCYPSLSRDNEIVSRESFDLALAGKLIKEQKQIVCNDFELHGSERVLVVSGPNNGGKTTLARTFGQLHYLACLGCQVPGTEAKLLFFDRLFTHFERAEDIRNLRGKLQDDLVRIHRILQNATPDSLVIMNEIFSSTTLKDAVYLGRKVFESISRLDLVAVCVTFLDELAAFDFKTVSMVSTVDPDDVSIRTYKLERRPADGLSYALAIAQKYGVTFERLKKRVMP
ncbi:MutS-related protein [Variovorax sp. Sphag1AA]|uniref:MutS-related protein n=1 Tax=Variovorax sp. Sphag1AA TaxID=2587027 RepID=UPI0017AF26BE|nr:DNA mismatch repair protein MutS [Variovorax sp. Sphag1AA]MBB3181208.1 hypothetical protein [Variovorax sp. Sphag1AA]